MIVPIKHKLSNEQIQELEDARNKNKDKNIDDRLKALLLYANGMKHKEIASITDFAQTYITELAAKYRKHGIVPYAVITIRVTVVTSVLMKKQPFWNHSRQRLNQVK